VFFKKKKIPDFLKKVIREKHTDKLNDCYIN